MKNIINFEQFITEGLITTYDHDILIKNIKQKLNNISIEYKDDKIIITIDEQGLSDINNILNTLEVNLTNLGGWFPASCSLINYRNMEKKTFFDKSFILNNITDCDSITIYYERKFGLIDTNEVPDKLYHLSIEEFKDKILKYGLITKDNSKLKDHPSRLYLCRSIENCEFLKKAMFIYYSGEKDKQIYQYDNKKFNKNTNFNIYEIDNSDKQISTLYKDDNYKDGYYILDNIKPNKIKLINGI